MPASVMEINIRNFAGLILATLLASCSGERGRSDVSKPLSDKVIAGKYLFFDKRLSFNNTKSCSSCHDPKFAFTDGYRRNTTATGELVLHNAPSLLNCASMKAFDWSNPATTTLELQHERPLFNQHPIELGVTGQEAEILKRLEADSLYVSLFKSAFPAAKKIIDFKSVISCLAAYVRSLESRNSAYDLYKAGNTNAMSVSAKEGMKLFFSPRMNCVSCHVPPDFTMATHTAVSDSTYINIGLYNVNGQNHYPSHDNGIRTITGLESDDGRFRVPSLRNAGFTSPYFHDGSVASLEEVIQIYSRGGQKIISGPFSGDGALNRFKDKRIKGFSISKEEQIALVDFLHALSDSAALTNPNFQNPFRTGQKEHLVE